MKDGKIPNPMTIHPIADYREVLSDFSGCGIRYEWSESSDECSFNFSFLYAGRLGHGCPVEKRFAAQ